MAIRQHNNRIIENCKEQFEVALRESETLVQLQNLDDYLIEVRAAISKLPKDQRAVAKEWLELVETRRQAVDPLQRRLKAFELLCEHGATKSGQYWHGEQLPEDHDPEFEEQYEDENMFSP